MVFPLPDLLKSINLEDPELVIKIREAEKENEECYYKSWIYSLSTTSSFRRFIDEKKSASLRKDLELDKYKSTIENRIKKIIKKKNIKLSFETFGKIINEATPRPLDPLISRFLLWKTILFGYRTLSEINKDPSNTRVDLKVLTGYIADSFAELGKLNKNRGLKESYLEKAVMMYEKSRRLGNIDTRFIGREENVHIELEKNSRDIFFRKECLEKAKKLMEEYPDEDCVEFIGRRAEVFLDLGQIEKEPEYFLSAYKDLRKQIGDFNDNSPEALFKLAKICNLFSNLRTDEDLDEKRLEVIETGIKTTEKLREKRTDCISDNVLGFFYIRRAEFQEDPEKKGEDYNRGHSLVKSCLKKLNLDYFNLRIMHIYGFAGEAFSSAYRIKINPMDSDESKLDCLEEGDLENIIYGIICSELSTDLREKISNRRGYNFEQNEEKAVAYQVVGREYYHLQHLIEKAARKQAGVITPEKIKEKIQEVLRWTNNKGERIFKNYNGGLLKILEFEDENI